MSTSKPHPSHPLLGRTAVRPAWDTLPEAVRRVVAAHLGAAVEAASDQGGGFTPGVAARLRLGDGTRAFVKAVPAAHPLAGAYRHEGRVATRLPTAAPVPRLRWHGAAADWTVLVFDDVAGRHPDLAPGSADTSGVVAAIAAMRQELTPARSRSGNPPPPPGGTGCTAGNSSPRTRPTTWAPGSVASWPSWPRPRPSGALTPTAQRWFTATSAPTTCSSPRTGR